MPKRNAAAPAAEAAAKQAKPGGRGGARTGTGPKPNVGEVDNLTAGGFFARFGCDPVRAQGLGEHAGVHRNMYTRRTISFIIKGELVVKPYSCYYKVRPPL